MVSRTAWVLVLALMDTTGRWVLAAEPSGLVQGMCVDAAKRPLAGVRARLLRATDEARTRRWDAAGENVNIAKVADETTTDSIGRFWLKNEPASGVMAVGSLQQPFFVLDMPGQLPEVRPLEYPIPHVVAEPKETATVRFIDFDKEPIAGAVAKCVGGDWPDGFLEPGRDVGLVVKADKQGVMKIPLSPNGTCVWVQAPGALPFAFRLQQRPPQNHHERGFDLHAVTAAPIELPMAPAGEATGRVVDAAGSPLPGMTVVGLVEPVRVGVGPRRPHDLQGIETVTDEQGRFRLVGLARDWVVLIAFNQAQSVEAEGLVSGIPWQAGDLVAKPMRLVRGLVWERVNHAPLRPQDEVRVAFQSPLLGTRWSAAIDSDGAFLIPVPKSVEGQPRLVPHPDLTDLGLGAPYGSKRSEPIVLRVQPKAATIPDAEVAANLNDFPRDYALAEGQWVRHIPAPFTKSRQAYWQFLRRKSGAAPEWMKPVNVGSWLLEKQPGTMIFVIDDHGAMRCIDASSAEIFLRQLLTKAFPQYSSSRIRFASFQSGGKWVEEKSLTIAGDIVLREGMPFAEGVRQLETLLQKDCQLPVELVVSHETVEALHVRGRIDTGPFKGKVVPIRLAEEAAQGPFGISGTPSSLVARLANTIELPHWFEADVTGDESLTWKISWPPLLPSNSPDRQKRLDIMRKLAPTVLRDQLGWDAEIHEVSLPLLTVGPQSK